MKMKSSTLVVLVGGAAFVIGGVLGHVFTRRYFILGDQEELLYRHRAIEREAMAHLIWLEASESTDRQATGGHRRAALHSLQEYLDNAESMKTVGLGGDWRLESRVKACLDQHSAPQRKEGSPTTSPG